MYSNQTAALGLPQYAGSDKLQRADMNAAYGALDAAIAARPAADADGKYPLAKLADLAQAAKPGGALELRIEAIESHVAEKAELGTQGRLKTEQAPLAAEVPFSPPEGMGADNVQQAIELLEGRFDGSGAALGALALGGKPASSYADVEIGTFTLTPNDNIASDIEMVNPGGNDNKCIYIKIGKLAYYHVRLKFKRITTTENNNQISFKGTPFFQAGNTFTGLIYPWINGAPWALSDTGQTGSWGGISLLKGGGYAPLKNAQVGYEYGYTMSGIFQIS